MENLSQRTADTLREMIVREQVYRFGEKLPNENELSVRLGISRTTLREAIRTLVSEGLLVVKRGKGTYVAEQLNRYAESDVELQEFTSRKSTLRDLYEARMIIEPEAAVLAAKRASEEEIDEILLLGEKCQQMLLKDPAGKERIQSESAFHGAILKASHNEFLASFLPMLSETIEKTFELNFNLDVVAEDAYKDHIMIMNFLKRRDEQALRSAVLIHLHHAAWNEELDL